MVEYLTERESDCDYSTLRTVAAQNVRSFYLDLAAWAQDDPARWAPWVAPALSVTENSAFWHRGDGADKSPK